MLVDGARHQLDLIHTEAARGGIRLNVLLDFVHVAEDCWTAVLAGHTDCAATEMTAQAATQPPPATATSPATSTSFNHGTALAAGWPIATGAVEGACRNLIADRLDITGARWGSNGAEAVRQLCALITNNDFEDYWNFHPAREHQRLYLSCDERNYRLTA